MGVVSGGRGGSPHLSASTGDVGEYLLGVGEPGSPPCPPSLACGLKELVLTAGMALLTSRPHVAMLMFI